MTPRADEMQSPLPHTYIEHTLETIYRSYKTEKHTFHLQRKKKETNNKKRKKNKPARRKILNPEKSVLATNFELGRSQ